MPELPEVETIARQLRAKGVEGKNILSVKISWARTVEPFSTAEFSKELKGTAIKKISRFGKWMLFLLSSGKTIMIHLRMTGGFSMGEGTHDRLELKLSDGLSLYYRDTRKFGRWRIVDDPDIILGQLGPDALSRQFTRRYFFEAVHKFHRMLKPLILDQSVVAGLGSIYADEALWHAGIHPMRLSNSLSDDKLGTLYQAVRQVLETGVRNGGASLGIGKGNYRDLSGKSGRNCEEVKAYGRAGKPCARCQTPLEKMSVAGRGSTFCPACQSICP